MNGDALHRLQDVAVREIRFHRDFGHLTLAYELVRLVRERLGPVSPAHERTLAGVETKYHAFYREAA
jgi:hypothetical protein